MRFPHSRPVSCLKEALSYRTARSRLRLCVSFTTSRSGNVSVHFHVYWMSESGVVTPCPGPSLFFCDFMTKSCPQKMILKLFPSKYLEIK